MLSSDLRDANAFPMIRDKKREWEGTGAGTEGPSTEVVARADGDEDGRGDSGGGGWAGGGWNVDECERERRVVLRARISGGAAAAVGVTDIGEAMVVLFRDGSCG